MTRRSTFARCVPHSKPPCCGYQHSGLPCSCAHRLRHVPHGHSGIGVSATARMERLFAVQQLRAAV